MSKPPKNDETPPLHPPPNLRRTPNPPPPNPRQNPSSSNQNTANSIPIRSSTHVQTPNPPPPNPRQNTADLTFNRSNMGDRTPNPPPPNPRQNPPSSNQNTANSTPIRSSTHVRTPNPPPPNTRQNMGDLTPIGSNMSDNLDMLSSDAGKLSGGRPRSRTENELEASRKRQLEFEARPRALSSVETVSDADVVRARVRQFFPDSAQSAYEEAEDRDSDALSPGKVSFRSLSAISSVEATDSGPTFTHSSSRSNDASVHSLSPDNSADFQDNLFVLHDLSSDQVTAAPSSSTNLLFLDVSDENSTVMLGESNSPLRGAGGARFLEDIDELEEIQQSLTQRVFTDLLNDADNVSNHDKILSFLASVKDALGFDPVTETERLRHYFQDFGRNSEEERKRAARVWTDFIRNLVLYLSDFGKRADRSSYDHRETLNILEKSMDKVTKALVDATNVNIDLTKGHAELHQLNFKIADGARILGEQNERISQHEKELFERHTSSFSALAKSVEGVVVENAKLVKANNSFIDTITVLRSKIADLEEMINASAIRELALEKSVEKRVENLGDQHRFDLRTIHEGIASLQTKYEELSKFQSTVYRQLKTHDAKFARQEEVNTVQQEVLGMQHKVLNAVSSNVSSMDKDEKIVNLVRLNGQLLERLSNLKNTNIPVPAVESTDEYLARTTQAENAALKVSIEQLKFELSELSTKCNLQRQEIETSKATHEETAKRLNKLEMSHRLTKDKCSENEKKYEVAAESNRRLQTRIELLEAANDDTKKELADVNAQLDIARRALGEDEEALVLITLRSLLDNIREDLCIIAGLPEGDTRYNCPRWKARLAFHGNNASACQDEVLSLAGAVLQSPECEGAWILYRTYVLPNGTWRVDFTDFVFSNTSLTRFDANGFAHDLAADGDTYEYFIQRYVIQAEKEICLSCLKACDTMEPIETRRERKRNLDAARRPRI